MMVFSLQGVNGFIDRGDESWTLPLNPTMCRDQIYVKQYKHVQFSRHLISRNALRNSKTNVKQRRVPSFQSTDYSVDCNGSIQSTVCWNRCGLRQFLARQNSQTTPRRRAYLLPLLRTRSTGIAEDSKQLHSRGVVSCALLCFTMACELCSLVASSSNASSSMLTSLLLEFKSVHLSIHCKIGSSLCGPEHILVFQ
jgi:hypothetical protein